MALSQSAADRRLVEWGYYFNIIGVHYYHGMNIFLMGTPLHTGVNFVHFKGAHCESYEIYMMQLTR